MSFIRQTARHIPRSLLPISGRIGRMIHNNSISKPGCLSERVRSLLNECKKAESKIKNLEAEEKELKAIEKPPQKVRHKYK